MVEVCRDLACTRYIDTAGHAYQSGHGDVERDSRRQDDEAAGIVAVERDSGRKGYQAELERAYVICDGHETLSAVV